MPLPFLKPEKAVAVIIAKRKPDGMIEDKHEEGEHEAGLMMAAESLIKAVNSKDIKQVADALKAAFEICDEAPHEEGPHINEEGELE